MTAETNISNFKAAMSQLAGAVSIVATGSSAGPAGWRGMTATAVCSLCAEPPSLIVCLNRASGTYKELQRNGLFSVNVLASRHVDLARRFAGQGGLVGGRRFAASGWHTGTLSVPVLADAVVSFECRVPQSFEYGTHTLLIGGIVTARWAGDGIEPLIYHRHRFRDLGRDIGMTGGSAA